MRIDQLGGDEVETFIDEIWVPAQRELVEPKRYSLKDEIREPGLAFIRSQVESEESVTYTARRGDAFLGYVTAEIQTPPPMVEQVRECHILELFVEPENRRHGIASELLGKVEGWAHSRDCEFMKLMVSSDNRAAIDLYESADFSVDRHSMKKRIESNG